MGELHLVIGPCGAGKTTWARRAFPEHAHPDAEELARTLFATPDRFRFYGWTRAVARRLLAAAADDLMARRVPTCVTATGATARERQPWVMLGQRHEVPVHVVLLAVDPEVCVARAQSDPRRPRSSRQAWPAVVDRWYQAYERPAESEGFASCREVDHA